MFINSKHKRLTQFISLLILLATLATFFVGLLASTPWRTNIYAWFRYLPYYAWAILPYGILYWLNVKRNRSFLQALIILFFTFVIIVFGAIVYTYAIILGFDPRTSIVLIAIPFYQFIISLLGASLVMFLNKRNFG